MTNIDVKLNWEYREKLDLLKKIIPNKDGGEIENDSEILEVLVDEFIAFVQMQASHHAHDHEWGCCGGGSCGWHDHGHDHWHEGCGCKH